MITLYLKLQVQPSKGADLEEAFRKVFTPAIRVRPGFIRVSLLRGMDHREEYALVIGFETEAQREEWVATEAHQRAWPELEKFAAKWDFIRYDVVHEEGS